MSYKGLDFFNRQEKLPWFSQMKVSSSTITILGVGGIGCNLALLAARLGFGEIHLIDCDSIEASNLNRQTLYSKGDIGKKKVNMAKETLDSLDNLNSEILAHDYNIFQDWNRTINITENSSIVLNGLDQPEIKRTLIGILCLSLGTPMVYSGTDPHSGYSGMVLYQASTPRAPCYECLQAILASVEDQSLKTKYTVNNIQSFDSIDWREMESEDFSQISSGATTILIAMLSSTLAMNQVIRHLHDQKCPHRIIFDLFLDSIKRFFLEKRKNCVVCQDI